METAIENEEKFVIIRDPDTEYFIQFAILYDKNEVLMDIPLVELSGDQIDDLRNMLNVEVARNSVTGEQMSIQKLFHHHELKKASKTVERILVQVFDIPVNYEVLMEIFS